MTLHNVDHAVALSLYLRGQVLDSDNPQSWRIAQPGDRVGSLVVIAKGLNRKGAARRLADAITLHWPESPPIPAIIAIDTPTTWAVVLDLRRLSGHLTPTLTDPPA